MYVVEDDGYKPFEPIKKTRDKGKKKLRNDGNNNALQEQKKKKNEVNWVNHDDSQSFTFTMDEGSQMDEWSPIKSYVNLHWNVWNIW